MLKANALGDQRFREHMKGKGPAWLARNALVGLHSLVIFQHSSSGVFAGMRPQLQGEKETHVPRSPCRGALRIHGPLRCMRAYVALIRPSVLLSLRR